MSDTATSVTDPSAFQNRSLAMQVLFAIVTLGFYTAYWFYATNKQLADGTDAEFDPVVRTLLMIVLSPILVGLYWLWQTANDLGDVTDQSGPLLFVLLLIPVANVAGWYMAQTGVNEIAGSA